MALAEFDLDPATADRVLALADPALRAATVAKLTGGANSAVFEVRMANGGAVVVKVYSELLHWKMAKEVFVYERLRSHDSVVPVPLVVAADESKSLLSHNVRVLTKLEGEHVLSIVDQLDEQALVEINRQLGAILHTLHEIRFAATRSSANSPRSAATLVCAAASSGTSPNASSFSPPAPTRPSATTTAITETSSSSGVTTAGVSRASSISRTSSHYVVYHWLELWDWFASLGQTEALEDLAGEMRLLMAA